MQPGALGYLMHFFSPFAVLAEIMLEIAMFWQSVASYSEDDNRFHIEGAIGPDTFHNWYACVFCQPGMLDTSLLGL